MEGLRVAVARARSPCGLKESHSSRQRSYLECGSLLPLFLWANPALKVSYETRLEHSLRAFYIHSGSVRLGEQRHSPWIPGPRQRQVQMEVFALGDPTPLVSYGS